MVAFFVDEYFMKIESLNQLFKQNPQFDRSDWRTLIRPCIDIVFTDDNDAKDGSYFGGKPYLPKDFVLPKAPKGNKYHFIGQINFADLAHINTPTHLPKTGLLSLFYLEYRDDWQLGDNEPFWGDDGYVKAFYFANTYDFVVHDDKDTATHAKYITFIKGVDLPCNQYFNVDYPSDAHKFYDVLDEIERADHLFGYPTNSSLGYDPTPSDDEWLPFISLKSHQELNWCWHDGDYLMVFITQSALTKGDFTHLKSDAG